MPGVYVGDTKSLVFPIMCDGYIKLPYLDMHKTDTVLALREGVWAQRDRFTIEAILTPYDINGYGTKTGSGIGLATSEKTPPSLAENISSNLTHYQSYQYFGTTRLTRKMMIFYNTNFQLYLENVAESNINQPAEYKLVAKFPTATSPASQTIESPTLIKSHNTLHGHYDANGYYNGISTSLRKFSTTATNTTPESTVTIVNTANIPYNTAAIRAAGAIGITNYANLNPYTSPIKSTGSIDIETASMPANTGEAFGTGSYIVRNQPSEAANNASNEYILVSDGTYTYKFYARTNTGGYVYQDLGTSPGLPNWQPNDWGYQIGADEAATAVNLGTAINRMRWHDDFLIGGGDWLDIVDISGVSATKTLSTSPFPTAAFNATLTLGSGLSNSNMELDDISGGDPGTEVDAYITMISTDATTIRYKATNLTDLHLTTGTSGGQAITYYRNDSTVALTSAHFATAIAHANGHNGKIVRTNSNNAGGLISLQQNVAGTNGDRAITLTANINSNHAVKSDFSGGLNEVDDEAYITIIDNESTAITKRYAPLLNNDAKSTGDTGTVGSSTSVVFFKIGTSNNTCAANLETAIEGSTGHDGGVLVSGTAASRTLTQLTAGASGNKNIDRTSNLADGMNDSNFGVVTSGVDFVDVGDRTISIYDAAGLQKKYKGTILASEISSGAAGGYTFYEIEPTSIYTTLENLKDAIISSYGHSGTIAATRNIAVLTLALGSGNSYQNNSLIGTWSATTSYTLTNWNNATSNNIICANATEVANIDTGETIYDSSGNVIGEALSVAGSTITLKAAPAVTVTTTVYASQPREALYLDSFYKLSCVFNKNGTVQLYINNNLVQEGKVTIPDLDLNDATFEFAPSDCFIGQDGTGNSTQFMGELYEIAMHGKGSTSLTSTTLSPGYNDIIFYYRFGE